MHKQVANFVYFRFLARILAFGLAAILPTRSPVSALAACLTPPGDLTRDRVASIVDVQCMLLMVLWSLDGETSPPPECALTKDSPKLRADHDCDGSLTVADAQLAISFVLGTLLSPKVDSDGDGCADACQSDLDGDGDFDTLDCAPMDPQVHHETDETCNGADDDCNGSVDDDTGTLNVSCSNADVCDGEEACVPVVQSPGLVISEIHALPLAAPAPTGQWIELYNASDAVVNIRGWRLTTTSSTEFVIDPGGALFVPVRGTVVVGASDDQASNGGVRLNAVVQGFALPQPAATIQLYDATDAWIDSVTYGPSDDPPAPLGASLARTNPDSTAPGVWSPSIATWNGGDAGSPAGPNLDVLGDNCHEGTLLACESLSPCAPGGCSPALGCTTGQAIMGKGECCMPDIAWPHDLGCPVAQPTWSHNYPDVFATPAGSDAIFWGLAALDDTIVAAGSAPTEGWDSSSIFGPIPQPGATGRVPMLLGVSSAGELLWHRFGSQLGLSGYNELRAVVANQVTGHIVAVGHGTSSPARPVLTILELPATVIQARAYVPLEDWEDVDGIGPGDAVQFVSVSTTSTGLALGVRVQMDGVAREPALALFTGPTGEYAKPGPPSQCHAWVTTSSADVVEVIRGIFELPNGNRLVVAHRRSLVNGQWARPVLRELTAMCADATLSGPVVVSFQECVPPDVHVEVFGGDVLDTPEGPRVFLTGRLFPDPYTMFVARIDLQGNVDWIRLRYPDSDGRGMAVVAIPDGPCQGIAVTGYRVCGTRECCLAAHQRAATACGTDPSGSEYADGHCVLRTVFERYSLAGDVLVAVTFPWETSEPSFSTPHAMVRVGDAWAIAARNEMTQASGPLPFGTARLLRPPPFVTSGCALAP